MFKSLLKLTEDVFTIATAPVKIAVDTTRMATKPIADMCKEVTEEIEDLADDDL